MLREGKKIEKYSEKNIVVREGLKMAQISDKWRQKKEKYGSKKSIMYNQYECKVQVTTASAACYYS